MTFFSALSVLSLPGCVAEGPPPPPVVGVPYGVAGAYGYPYADYPWYYGPEVDIYGGYGRGGYGRGYRGGGFHGGGGFRGGGGFHGGGGHGGGGGHR